MRFCESLNLAGSGASGGSDQCCPAMPGARRGLRAAQLGGRLRRAPRGLHVRRSRSGGCGRRRPGPLPRPRVVQCLTSPGGSSAPSAGPDGFRNRVAAVSALSQPHLCRPALGSPAAPRSQPGKPTLAGSEPEPPTRCSRTPRCRSAAGETAAWGPGPRAPPAPPGGDAPDAGGGEAGAAEMLGRWEKGCAPGVAVSVHSTARVVRCRRDWGIGVGGGEARRGEVLLETR